MSDRPAWVRWLPRDAAATIDRDWKPLWEQLRRLGERQPWAGELELEAVEEQMPELIPLYERLIELAGGGDARVRWRLRDGEIVA